MRSTRTGLAPWRSLLMLLVTALPVAMQDAQAGLAFEHGDWEIACDNTRTCRAAGYHKDGAPLVVSVLLTRKAGPHQPVTGQVVLDSVGGDDESTGLPEKFEAVMRINGQPAGTVPFTESLLVADLAPEHIASLLPALLRDSTIEFSYREHRWTLSDRGARAVFLKMDEFQGRLDTPGALVRKGRKAESSVHAPRPVPRIVPVTPVKPQPGDEHFATRHAKALREELLASVKDDDCDALRHPDEDIEADEASREKGLLDAVRLSRGKMLVSALCWRGAYNAGTGYWVVNDTPPFKPLLVTDSATSYDAGVVHAMHKSRGLGDCWHSNTWVWNGTRFVQAESSSTGMCKGFAGGTWSLPTVVSDVSPAKP